MHDFQYLPHHKSYRAPSEDHVKNSLTSHECSNTIIHMSQETPEIPHYFWKPVDQYIIALVGFLQAQGVQIYNSQHKPDFTYHTSSQKPDKYLLPVGLRLYVSLVSGKLLIDTVYVPNPECWQEQIDAYETWVSKQQMCAIEIYSPDDDDDDDDDDEWDDDDDNPLPDRVSFDVGDDDLSEEDIPF